MKTAAATVLPTIDSDSVFHKDRARDQPMIPLMFIASGERAFSAVRINRKTNEEAIQQLHRFVPE